MHALPHPHTNVGVKWRITRAGILAYQQNSEFKILNSPIYSSVDCAGV